jgi:HlyD family secretion protein
VKKFIIILFVIILILVILSGAGMLLKGKISASGKSTVVRVENLQRGELIEIVSAPGEIEPKSKVELSAKVSARIMELPYEEGEMVTCGNPNANPPIPASVLIKLDAKDLESQLQSAQANASAQAAQLEVNKAQISGQKATLIGLEASLEQAKRDLERQSELLQSKDISQSTFDQTKLKLDELQSRYESSVHSLEAAELGLTVLNHNLDAANARVDEAKENLTYTTITSPIDGVITRINAEVGEVVVFGTMNNPGTVIMEVADLSKMLVVAQVDEADVGKMQTGQKASVYVDAFPDIKFSGIVSSVALAHTSANTGNKYFRTEILLDNTEQKLFSGLTAHVDIETRKHTNVFKAPTQAVLAREIEDLPLEIRENSPNIDKAKTFATVVYRYVDGKAVVTPVKIGQSDLTHTIIESGITQEDKIVVGPYKVLENITHDQKIQDEREVQTSKKTDANKE